MLVRPAQPSDVPQCGAVIYEAFRSFCESVSLSPEFETAEAASDFVAGMLKTPGALSFVVELDGSVVACNFLDCGDDVAAVGPLAVHPDVQGRGIGRLLMNTVIQEGKERKKLIRLTQVASNRSSAALYLSMGFKLVEPLVAFSGAISSQASNEFSMFDVRKMCESDIEACDALHKEVVGVSRKANITQGVTGGYAENDPGSIPLLVVCRKGTTEVLGFTTGFFIDGCCVAKDEEIARCLIYHASLLDSTPTGIKFHVIATRNPHLVQWALANGFKIAELSNLMTLEESYIQPSHGVYLPGVSY